MMEIDNEKVFHFLLFAPDGSLLSLYSKFKSEGLQVFHIYLHRQKMQINMNAMARVDILLYFL